jgi:hypothetical protein
MLRSALPRPAILLLLASGGGWACGGGEGTTTTVQEDDTLIVNTQEYELELQVLLPGNESGLFSDLVRLDIAVDGADGPVGTWSFDELTSGSTLEAEEVGALDEAVITLLGYDEDGTLVARGSSQPTSLAEGEDAVRIFLPRLDDFGWLNSLETGLAGTAAAGDETGRFLVFGGTAELTYGRAPTASNKVWAWSPDELERGLSFSELGQLPGFEEHDGGGRTGHTATRLGGTHDNQDLIAIAGGSPGFRHTDLVTGSVVTWDPATDSVSDTGLSLDRRYLHLATPDGAGNVVFSGGLGNSGSPELFTNVLSIDVLNGSDLSIENTRLPSSDSYYLFHGAARWGERGVLLCGGMEFRSDSGADVHGRCGLVSPSGVYTDQDTLGIELPEPRFHHAMIGLDDGRVLVTGGATWSEEGGYEVTDSAWILNKNGTAWTDVGPLHRRRAAHRMARLPDGRMTVVGGADEISTWFVDSDDAIACAEVFTPGRDDFREAPPCLASDETGALPRTAVLPALAEDRTLGVLAVGGATAGFEGASGAALYVPRPSDQ